MKQHTLWIWQGHIPAQSTQDTLLVCSKFWKSFKNEVSTEWELIDKYGRATKVKVKECENNIVLIHEGWSHFRILNEVYNEREDFVCICGWIQIPC